MHKRNIWNIHMHEYIYMHECIHEYVCAHAKITMFVSCLHVRAICNVYMWICLQYIFILCMYGCIGFICTLVQPICNVHIWIYICTLVQLIYNIHIWIDWVYVLTGTCTVVVVQVYIYIQYIHICTLLMHCAKVYIYDHICMYIYVCICTYMYTVQSTAFGVLFNPNIPSSFRWSLFNRTWQKRPRELEYWPRFEIEAIHGTVYSICQHTATYCNTLQHTATHCNTLQHTATHCNNARYRVMLYPGVSFTPNLSSSSRGRWLFSTESGKRDLEN